MAITQDRMIRLIDAGTSLIESFVIIKNKTKEHDQRLKRAQQAGDSIDWQSEFEQLVRTIENAQPSVGAIAAIAGERGHFNARGKQNRLNRDHMRHIRRNNPTYGHTKPAAPSPNYNTIPDDPPAVNLDLDSNPDLNIETLHQALFSVWTQSRSTNNPTIDIGTIVATIANHGETNPTTQQSLITQLEAENRILPAPGRIPGIAGEYTVADPQTGGLLPNRIIGLGSPRNKEGTP